MDDDSSDSHNMTDLHTDIVPSNSHYSNSLNSSQSEFFVYKRRWFILSVVCLLNISNAMIWLTFSPVANEAEGYYNADSMQINWLSLVFLIASIPFGFVTTWVLDTIGLRLSILLSAWLNGIGAIIRGISTIDGIPDEHRFKVVLIGQIVTSCAQTFVMFCPTKLAAVWFAENQRATANMIASMANPLGILVANVIGPAIVKTQGDMPTLMWVSAGPAVFGLFLASFGVCSSVPPTPPSSSAAEESEPFFQGFKKLLKVKPYWILCFSFGAGLAIFSAVTTFLEQILCPRNYDNNFSGYCGILLIGFGLVGAALAGLFIDKTKRFEEVTKLSLSFAVISFIIFLEFARYRDIPVPIAAAVALFGCFGLALYPVMMELAVECTYPIAEATSSGLLFISGQIQGLIYMVAVQFLTQDLSEYESNQQNACTGDNAGANVKDWTVPTLFFAAVGTFAAVLFVTCFRTDYKRLEAEDKAKSQAIINSPVL